MSKKFHAEDRETGKRWEPLCQNQFLVMYDSGYLAIVDLDYGCSIRPLDPKRWKTVFHESMSNLIERS